MSKTFASKVVENTDSYSISFYKEENMDSSVFRIIVSYEDYFLNDDFINTSINILVRPERESFEIFEDETNWLNHFNNRKRFNQGSQGREFTPEDFQNHSLAAVNLARQYMTTENLLRLNRIISDKKISKARAKMARAQRELEAAQNDIAALTAERIILESAGRV